ncbi:MAG: branched-chain alpha-keto acid dehydrogenase subunit E2 [Deltaproteobacteria bacterium]|nr:branched-chain alpha-keto acid dehydrogenase subunit E2 [Deltaproteobacteria bacterium]
MPDQIEIRIPDIGDFEDVEIVEILVGPGDRVEVDEPIISIESDKATMEVPSPVAGEILELRVSLGDSVSEGTILALVAVEEAGEVSPQSAPPPEQDTLEEESPAEVETAEEPAATSVVQEQKEEGRSSEPSVMSGSEDTESSRPSSDGTAPHAGPGARRFARELGVDLNQASGSGPHGRILRGDIVTHVKSVMPSGSGGVSSGSGIPTVPDVDFSRYGPVTEVALPKIRRVAAVNLSRSWLNAPHVTQQDEADVTEMEKFRRRSKDEAARRDLKLSPLHFVLKAVSIALREFPDFRSSLSPDGEGLIVKDYYHLGVAVDTEHGLVVPVLRDVDQKGIFQLAGELAELAEKARLRKLAPADMQGAVFSISSLGGIGGTAFSPIVNVPEVSILGLSKLEVKPRWSGSFDLDAGGTFEPRTILPLSLSYDHRVIDGAAAARFTTRVSQLLSDPAYLLL